MEDCNAVFTSKLADFDLAEARPPYRFRVARFLDLEAGIAVRLVPVDHDEERRMRRLRDRLAGRLGVRRPEHEGYEFHLGLGYLLRWLGVDEERELMGVLGGVGGGGDGGWGVCS